MEMKQSIESLAKSSHPSYLKAPGVSEWNAYQRTLLRLATERYPVGSRVRWQAGGRGCRYPVQIVDGVVLGFCRRHEVRSVDSDGLTSTRSGDASMDRTHPFGQSCIKVRFSIAGGRTILADYCIKEFDERVLDAAGLEADRS